MLLRFAPLFCGGLLAVLAVACTSNRPSDIGPSDVSETPRSGGRLVLASVTAPTAFDPHKRVQGPSQVEQSFVWRRLLRFPSGPQHGWMQMFPLEGDLAERWETSADGKIWTFYLRQGVKYHNLPPVNGREVTADDVKFSLERAANPKVNLSGDARYWEQLAGVEVLDKYTVRVQFSQISPPQQFVFAWITAPILPPEARDKDGTYETTESMIGQGPFMHKEYIPESRHVFVRNPDYYRKGLPYVDELEQVYIKDPATRLAAMRTGKIDFLAVTLQEQKDLERTAPPGGQFHSETGTHPHGLMLRSDEPPFNDVRVRRAVALAMDRKSIIDSYWEGDAVYTNMVAALLADWFKPLEAYSPEARKYLTEYNPQEAKRLLAEAGYPNGLTTTLTTTSGYEVSMAYLAFIQKWLENVGIKTNVNVLDYGAWLGGPFRGDYHGINLGTFTRLADPDDALYGFFYPGQQENKTHVNDPQLTPLLLKQRQLTDYEERKKVVWEASDYIAKQAWVVFLAEPNQHWALSPWVRDFSIKTLPPYDYGTLERAWVTR